MKKIPTLFHRIYENHKKTGITDEVRPGFEWVLAGEGIATVKYDGSCCAIIDGTLYKRYDAKAGRPVPPDAIKCQDEPDPVTGHLPCWVNVDSDDPADKWFWAAKENYAAEMSAGEISSDEISSGEISADKMSADEMSADEMSADEMSADEMSADEMSADGISPCELPDGTYEAIGPHFQSNPYGLEEDTLVRHGAHIIDAPRTFEGIKEYLMEHNIEGIVFWRDGEPKCKIKRSDFGFSWPDKQSGDKSL